MAVIFALSAPPAAESQKRRLEPFSGTFSGASRTPSGRLPDGSRTSSGRFPGTSRTPSAHSDAGYMPKLSVLALLRHFSGTFSGASRTPPGRLPDPSRTSFGRLPGASRTPSARSDAGFLLVPFVFALYKV